MSPARRRFGPRLERQSRQAEAVLVHVVARSGRQAGTGNLAVAWPEVHGAPLPDHLRAGRWSRLFAPAVQAGRVVESRQGRGVYFQPAGPALPLPAEVPVERAFGPRLVGVSADAEAVLAALVNRMGTAIPSSHLEARWAEVHGRAFPPEFRHRIRRLLEPALQTGRVVASYKSGQLLLRPGTRPDLPDPTVISDEDRVWEALRRAVLRLNSPVPLAEVEAEIAGDPELRLRGRLRISDVLANLKRRSRIVALRVHRRARVPQQYYALPAGPRQVRRGARTLLDRRLDIIRGYWEATGGLPFTTHVIRRQARRSAPDLFDGEPVWAWTCALHHLRDSGALVKLRRARRRFALWAPAAPWQALGEDERSQRIRDFLRRPVWPPLTRSSQLGRQLRYDPNRISRNNDVRALLALARARWVDRASDAEEEDVLRQRPLTLDEIRQAVEPEHPLMPPDLATAFAEAARLRNGMVRSEVVALELDSNFCYYDLEPTEAALALCEFLRVLYGTDVRRLSQRTDALQEQLAPNDARVIAIAPSLLVRQADALEAGLTEALTALRRSRVGAPLLPPEREACRDLVGELRALHRRVRRLRPLLPAGAAADVPVAAPQPLPDAAAPLHDLEVAWQEVAPLTPYPLKTPRELPNRLPQVRRVRAPERVGQSAAGGRLRHVAFDRTSYVVHLAQTRGGPVLRYLARLGGLALGGAADVAPLASVLASPVAEQHAGAAAGLGLLDDGPARAALVAYLGRIVESGRGPVSLPAGELAVWGLAPLPFAPLTLLLADGEAEILQAVAEDVDDERLRSAALTVLRFWRGECDPAAELAYYGPRPLRSASWPPPPFGASAGV